MAPRDLSLEHEELIRRVAFTPDGLLKIGSDRLTDKFRAFFLRERGLVTTSGIGVVEVRLTDLGELEAKVTQVVSTKRGRVWTNQRVTCRACQGAPPAPFAARCPHCRKGFARLLCGDHAQPEALPGCGCFDGSDRAMGFRVAPAPVRDESPSAVKRGGIRR